MYIHHAANVAHGVAYDRTGYIYNPHNPAAGPKTYPPVFPLLLVPIYVFFGLNLTLMKLEVIVFFVAGLIAIYFVLKHEGGPAPALAIVALLGFNPSFWRFSENVLSDLPFSFFCWTSLWLILLQQKESRVSTPTTRNIYGALTGLGLYLAIGTRTVGVALVFAYVAYELGKWRRLRPVVVVSLSAVLICTFLQKALLPSDISYFDQLGQSPSVLLHTMIHNAWAYQNSISDLWANGFTTRVAVVISRCVFLLSALGFVLRITSRRTITVLDVFFVSYGLIIVVWPAYQGLRLVIPVIPLYLFYAYAGLDYVGRSLSVKRAVVAAVMILALLSYLGAYRAADYGPMRDGVEAKQSVALFNWIRTYSRPKDVFIFWKPRALSLYTNRPAAVYFAAPSDVLWGYFESIHAKYIIVSSMSADDRADLSGVVSTYRRDLETAYRNPNFAVYRVITPSHRPTFSSAREKPEGTLAFD
jgi:4-amino-4-deoxy-L-arabinose transferase-like glycosyltransferase